MIPAAADFSSCSGLSERVTATQRSRAILCSETHRESRNLLNSVFGDDAVGSERIELSWVPVKSRMHSNLPRTHFVVVAGTGLRRLWLLMIFPFRRIVVRPECRVTPPGAVRSFNLTLHRIYADLWPRGRSICLCGPYPTGQNRLYVLEECSRAVYGMELSCFERSSIVPTELTITAGTAVPQLQPQLFGNCSSPPRIRTWNKTFVMSRDIPFHQQALNDADRIRTGICRLKADMSFQ